MKALSQSGVARSGIGGSLDGRGRMTGTVRYETMSSNQSSFQEVAGRTEGVVASLRSAVERYAATLMDVIPVGQRSRSETAFLLDCQRGRRPFNAENVARLLVLASRTNTAVHGLSECIRAQEMAMAKAVPLCPTEVSDAEDDSNYPLDHAQKLYEREPTRTRAQQVVELAVQQFHKTRTLIDVFTLRAARLP